MAGSTARAALALALIIAGCRTAAPAPTISEAPARQPAPAVVYVPVSPKVLVTKDDLAFVLLQANLARPSQGAPSFEVSYLASVNAGDALAKEAPRRAMSLAAALLEAFDPLLPAQVHEAQVTAVFGVPGASGLALPAHLTRGTAGWGTAQPGELVRASLPPLPMPVARPASGERAAVTAALTFLECTDERDGDGAWALASAAVRATISRRTFEDAVWPARWQSGHGERSARFVQYDLHTSDFRVGDLLVVSFVSERGVETVGMRLDDDQEWRVADFARGAAIDPGAASPDGLPSDPATPASRLPGPTRAAR